MEIILENTLKIVTHYHRLKSTPKYCIEHHKFYIFGAQRQESLGEILNLFTM